MKLYPYYTLVDNFTKYFYQGDEVKIGSTHYVVSEVYPTMLNLYPIDKPYSDRVFHISELREVSIYKNNVEYLMYD